MPRSNRDSINDRGSIHGLVRSHQTGVRVLGAEVANLVCHYNEEGGHVISGGPVASDADDVSAVAACDHALTAFRAGVQVSLREVVHEYEAAALRPKRFRRAPARGLAPGVHGRKDGLTLAFAERLIHAEVPGRLGSGATECESGECNYQVSHEVSMDCLSKDVKS